MPRSDLEHTIVEPAKKVGLTFDPPSLVQRILDEAGEDEGMLPLLQYALKETWALRKGSTMTGDSYARSGGVREAIRITAERTFDALSSEDQQAARQLFLRLVTPGEGQEDTRARAAMPADQTQRKIVEQFAGPRTRLLVTGWDRAARPTVEVAHEALIRTWPRLAAWIDANREKLRSRAAILQAKAEWEQHGRRDDLLLPSGFQLERARTLLEDPGDLSISDIEEFIVRSSAREAAERKRMRRITALPWMTGIAAVTVGATVWVWVAYAQQAALEAQLAAFKPYQIADRVHASLMKAQGNLDSDEESIKAGTFQTATALEILQSPPRTGLVGWLGGLFWSEADARRHLFPRKRTRRQDSAPCHGIRHLARAGCSARGVGDSRPAGLASAEHERGVSGSDAEAAQGGPAGRLNQ